MLVGRGRGHVSTDRREQLRRPVDPTYVSPLDAIATKIATLKEDSTSELEAVGGDIARHCVSGDKLKLMVCDLHERSLVNRKFGTKCAMALATQSQLMVDGKKLRAVLMTNIQTDFEDKENLRHHNMNRFLNTFAFIGEVFRHIRVENGAPIDVLAIALVEYCKLLIAGTEPEVELCVQQLAYNGKLLKQWNPKQLAELQVLIRSSCMVPGTDARCLCWLHLACDLDRSNYCPLSTELGNLYQTRLGSKGMEVIHELLTTPDPEFPAEVPEEAVVTSGLNGVHIAPPTFSPPPDRKKHTGGEGDYTEPACLPLKQRDPRVARHAGGGDSAPPDKPRFAPAREPRTPRNPAGDADRNRGPGYRERRNDPRNDPRDDPRNDPANWLPRHEPMPERDRDIWGVGRRGGSSYGHDDRFDRDDDFYGSRGARNSQRGGRGDARKGPPPPVPCASTEESWD